MSRHQHGAPPSATLFPRTEDTLCLADCSTKNRSRKFAVKRRRRSFACGMFFSESAKVRVKFARAQQRLVICVRSCTAVRPRPFPPTPTFQPILDLIYRSSPYRTAYKPFEMVLDTYTVGSMCSNSSRRPQSTVRIRLENPVCSDIRLPLVPNFQHQGFFLPSTSLPRSLSCPPALINHRTLNYNT